MKINYLEKENRLIIDGEAAICFQKDTDFVFDSTTVKHIPIEVTVQNFHFVGCQNSIKAKFKTSLRMLKLIWK